MNEKFKQVIGWTLLAIIVILFTLYGFVIKQECDIDRIYLWCRLHPFSVGDFLGVAMFYGGALLISGLLPIKLYNPENSVRWNILWFALMFFSIVLIWNT